MVKFFLRFLLLILIVAISAIAFLSYFGLETDKFDGLIKNKANEVNRHVKLEFQNTKIYLNPIEINLLVKLQKPKILAKDNEIILSKLDLILSLRSFFTSDFLLKRAQLMTIVLPESFPLLFPLILHFQNQAFRGLSFWLGLVNVPRA